MNTFFSRFALALCVPALLAAGSPAIAMAAPIAAAGSSEWLQRQFSTDHGASHIARKAEGRPGREFDGPGADLSGHAFSTAWLKRQLTGDPGPLAPKVTSAAAGPGPDRAARRSELALSGAWLKRQFTTSRGHPTL